MIYGLKPYSAMKDSGVECLGKVPEHWEVRRLRNVAEVRISNVDKHATESEQSVRLCNYVDVYKNDYLGSNMHFMQATATKEEIARFGLVTGDVLITKDSEAWDDIGVPALVVESADGLVSGYHLALLRPFANCLMGGFLLRALQSRHVGCQFHLKANGVTRFGLSQSAIKSVSLPAPPVLEQIAIVRFLNHVDRRIRRYIRAKQKLIALLKEQKQAMIHQAVTGQFDVRTGKPYLAYKDSGVEWLGKVPEHWEVRQLGRIGRFFKGGGGTKEDERESGVPCVRYGDLYTHHRFFITASRACVTTDLAATAYTPLRYGDVLFAGSGETVDEIGTSAVNLIRGSACCGGDVIIFRPSIRVDVRFLGYASDCPASARQKACMGRGFTVMHIYARDLKYMAVACPPVPEQAAIVRFLDQCTANINASAVGARREIELLREYRTRLIADAVTGKLDLREAAEGLPELDSHMEESIDDLVRADGDSNIEETDVPQEVSL